MFELTIKSLEKLKSYIKYTDEHYAMPQGVETQRKILQRDKETIEDYDRAITALENQRWMPVNELMPKEYRKFHKGDCNEEDVHMVSDDVLVTVLYNDGSKDIGLTATINGKFDCCKDYKITAWMPLPEPYKGGET